MHETSELVYLAIVVLVALASGMLLARVRQPAIVGYILAGVVLGPSGFGLVKDRDDVALLAELGALLLLFLIGMELQLGALKRVLKIAAIATGLQVVVAVAVTFAFSHLFGWSLPHAILLGFVISLSSTAVALKMLEDIGELKTEIGRMVLGILVAQDLAVVPMLIILNGMGGGDGFDLSAIPALVGAIGLLALIMWYLGRKRRIRLPFRAIILKTNDLAPLAALAVCFAFAAIAAALNLTAAYGAFVAGLLIGGSTERLRMIRATEPIQAVLVMMFFLSIGLLIDLRYVWTHVGSVVLLLFVVLILKSVINTGILRFLGEPWPRAFLAGVTLSQIGEFSFVLAGAGVAMGVVAGDDSRLMVAVIALSLLISPIWLLTARRMQALAARGISGFSDTLRLVYGPEARLVRNETGRAAGQLRLLADFVLAIFGWRLPPRKIAGLLEAPKEDKKLAAEPDA